MPRIAVALLVALAAPAVALADGQPPIYRRKSPPPRASTAAELAGTWNVQITTRFSSCPGFVRASIATWTVTHAGDTWTVKGADAGELTGPIERPDPRFFKATLRPSQQPGATALQVNYVLKDRFSGALMRAQLVKDRPRDPLCLVLQDVSADRAAP